MKSIKLPTALLLAVWLVAGASELRAADGEPVYLPMIFRTETQSLRTTACLRVKERIYSSDKWWQASNGRDTAPERALKGVLAAMQAKDPAALLKLSDPSEVKDQKSFDEQASAFFEQLGKLKLLAVPRGYEFDGLALFFVELGSEQRTFFAPMVFTEEGDGSFGFLPRRTRKTTYRLVEEWFNSAWGPAKSAQPSYCSDAEIKDFTHRVSLVPQSATSNASELYLKGFSFNAAGDLAPTIERAKATLAEIVAATGHPGIDDLARHMSVAGADRAKEWFASAGPKERDEYKAAIAERAHAPFFLFDLNSVLVVYTRSSTGFVQVMYLTSGPGKELVWTNASYITTADQIFKQGPLDKSASLDKPFSNMTVK